MKKSFQCATFEHEKYGTITYDENFWSGKKKIFFGDVELIKKAKKLYVWNDGENDVEVRLQGGYLSGVKIYIGNEEICVIPQPQWYEVACSIFIFAFVLVWGNSVALCSIFPIVGGAIGGAVSGLGAVISLLLMKKAKTISGKLFAWLCTFVATLLICFIIAIAIIYAMVMAA